MSVTIGSSTYTTYGTVAEADVYLGGSVTADAWRGADDDTKARALVSATRWIDELTWIEPYDTFEKRLAEPAFANASFELAASFAADTDFRTSFSAAQVKRIKAGSVELENFRGASVQITTPFPSTIMALIGNWLAGAASGYSGAVSFGTCRETKLDRGYDFNQGL